MHYITIPALEIGTASSGNFGHAGRKGSRGGSVSKRAASGAPSEGALRSLGLLPEDARELSSALTFSSPYGQAILKKYNTTPAEINGKIEAARVEVAGMQSTASLHTDANGNYTAERAELHRRIADELYEKAVSDTPPVFLLTGGRPGSGKSTMLHNDTEFSERAKGLVVDSDVIKQRLAEHDGLQKLGTRASAYHEESDAVTTILMERAVSERKSLVYDATMKSTGKTLAIVREAKRAGYRIEVGFMNTSITDSVLGAVDRFLGPKSGRFVDPIYIASHDHKNEVTFEAIKNEADSWKEYRRTSAGSVMLVSKG